VKYSTDLGVEVILGPLARKWVMTEIDRVTAFASAMATV
jgi:hypothetical protein